MDDEENKPGITQIPLLHDMVYNSTLPPKKTMGTKKRINYSPNYDPDTIDLFSGIDDSITDELRKTAGQVIDDLVEEFTAEIGKRLREELSDQLTSILEDLNHRDTNDRNKAP